MMTVLLGQHKESKPSPPAQQNPYQMYNIEIPDQISQKVESHRGRRRIRRLPEVLRNEHNYVPKVISFGPFHHGKPELHLGETFKHKALETFLSAAGKDKLLFHNTIMAAVDEIRRCYDPINESDDTALAEMMLLDGFFIISLMELVSNSENLINVLYAVGMAGFSYAVRDVFLLENQIPYIVIKLLMKLRYDDARKGEDLLNNFLNFAAFQGHHSEHETTRNDDGGEETEPIHLLEAIRRKLVSKPKNERKSNSSTLKVKEKVYLRTRLYTSRSVIDLKSKGIDFKPSPSSNLRDVKFSSHFLFNGNLSLPVRCISEKTKVLFTNLIAYETSPDNANDYAITSYVNLMKSLIHSARDVKELREKRILVSNLGSDDDVFQLLKDIDTCGMENSGIFHEVKERIEEHYNSKAKTWMAELVHTYFESPWTAIALLAATLLMCLTFLQTYFTIHPAN